MWRLVPGAAEGLESARGECLAEREGSARERWDRRCGDRLGRLPLESKVVWLGADVSLCGGERAAGGAWCLPFGLLADTKEDGGGCIAGEDGEAVGGCSDCAGRSPEMAIGLDAVDGGDLGVAAAAGEGNGGGSGDESEPLGGEEGQRKGGAERAGVSGPVVFGEHPSADAADDSAVDGPVWDGAQSGNAGLPESAISLSTEGRGCGGCRMEAEAAAGGGCCSVGSEALVAGRSGGQECAAATGEGEGARSRDPRGDDDDGSGGLGGEGGGGGGGGGDGGSRRGNGIRMVDADEAARGCGGGKRSSGPDDGDGEDVGTDDDAWPHKAYEAAEDGGGGRGGACGLAGSVTSGAGLSGLHGGDVPDLTSRGEKTGLNASIGHTHADESSAAHALAQGVVAQLLALGDATTPVSRASVVEGTVNDTADNFAGTAVTAGCCICCGEGGGC